MRESFFPLDFFVLLYQVSRPEARSEICFAMPNPALRTKHLFFIKA
jgi:hypothetical protein